MTNKYQKADRFVCAHHINLWKKKPPINHSTYQTPNSEAKPPASSQTCLRAETEPYAAGRPKINRKQQNYATQPESSTTLGEFTTKKREQTRLGASNHRAKQDLEPPDANFPTIQDASMPMRGRGAKTPAIGCEMGVGRSSCFSLSLLPRRMHFGKGGSSERGG